MKDAIKNTETLFKYFNGGVYTSFIIFIAATIYILIIEKNKKIKDFFVWYTVVILLVVWNPVAIYILNKFINFAALYRIYFMLPLYVTISYAFTKLISRRKNVIIKNSLIVVLIGYICFFHSESVFKNVTYKYNNFYKLPDESVKVADIIYNDDTYKEKKAIVPYGMSSQIQQIHASINLLYTRIVTNPKDENGKPMPTDSDDPAGYEPIEKINEGDTKYLDNLCKENMINYVVLSKNLVLQEPMEKYNFEELEKTDENIIYIRKK